MIKILVVDDDSQATILLERHLVSQGYQAISETDSSKAVKVASATNPDIIILDLMMPEPDGFKVCRMLREKPKFRFTPILILTALDDTDSRIVAFGAGADGYVTKPYHINELQGMIQKLLEEKED